MLSFLEYTSAASPSVRLRNSDLSYWDFNQLLWVGTQNANTKIAYSESVNGDGTSFYAVNLTMPAGGPFIQEAILGSGEVVAYDTTAVDANISTSVSDVTAIKAITDKFGFTGSGPYYANSQIKASDNLNFTAQQLSSLNSSTPASITGAVGSVTAGVTVTTNNDKGGYALSTAGVLAIWNQATAAAGILVNTMGAKLRDLVLGTDNMMKISADAQDLSATLKVDAKVVEDKTGFALTSDYDSAKTAATQTSVNAIPTTPLLTTDTRLNHLNADISAIPTTPLLAANYTAPDNTSITTILTAIQNATYGLARLDTEIDTIITALSSLSTNTDMQTVLTRLTNARALLIDNLQYLTAAPGLTSGQVDIITAARDEAKLARQMATNKATIASDGLSVTIYADNGTTPLWTFSIPDNKHRIPT